MAVPIKVVQDFSVGATPALGEYDPHVLALADGRFDIALERSHSATDTDAIIHRFNADGSDTGYATAPFTPSDGIEGAPSLVTLGQLQAVAFTDRIPGQPTNSVHLTFYGFLNGNGTDIIVDNSASEKSRPEVVALTDGTLAVVWVDNTTATIMGRIYDPALGAFTSVPYALSTTPTMQIFGVAELGLTALSNGGFAASWRDDAGTAHVGLFDSFGNTIANITTPGATTVDVVELAGGRVAGLYYDTASGAVSMITCAADGSDATAPVAILPSVGHDFFAATALHDGRLFVAVADPNDNIVGRIINADGTPDSEVFTVADSGNILSRPHLATLADGRFVVTYEDATTGDVMATVLDPREEGVNLVGTAQGDDYYGTAFRDIFTMGAGNDHVRAGDENDYLDGQQGDDHLEGGGGQDFLEGGFGNDILDGGGGVDVVNYRGRSPVTVNLRSGIATGPQSGIDTLIGIEDAFGGAGNDTLIASAVDNYLDGGAGTDTLSYAGTSHGVQIELFSGLAVDGTSLDIFGSFENATGGDGGDVIADDGFDANVFNGGLGVDTAVYIFSGAPVTINLAGGTATTGSVVDTLQNFENAVGSDDGGSITGNNGINWLWGRGGTDTLRGEGGNDTLVGSGGTDSASFTGTQAEYVIRKNLDGSVRVTDTVGGRNGMDTLYAVESLVFSNGTISTASLQTVSGYSLGNLQVASTQFASNTGWSNQTNTPRMLADVNGDQLDDIVGFGNGGVLVSLSNGNGTFGALQSAHDNFGVSDGWASNEVSPRQLGDVNGDGRADIVGFSTDTVVVALANGTGGFGQSFAVGTVFGSNSGFTNQTSHPRMLADVNGDNRADIVGFSGTAVKVAFGNSTGGFNTEFTASVDFGTAQGWSNNSTTPRKLADVNGDGRADIVAFGNTGVFVSLAQANGTFANKFLASQQFAINSGWVNDNTNPRQLMDINGDGRADIVGFGNAGTYAALANANGTFGALSLIKSAFGAQTGGWSTQNVNPRAVGDIDGDGAADIVGFGNSHTFASLSAETGFQAASLPLSGYQGPAAPGSFDFTATSKTAHPNRSSNPYWSGDEEFGPEDWAELIEQESASKAPAADFTIDGENGLSGAGASAGELLA